MDTRNYLLEDRHFLIQALAGIVGVEQQRIIKGGIAKESQLESLTDVVQYFVSLAKKNSRVNGPLNTLANLCTILKSIQIPGDFEKYTVGSNGSELGNEFYIALDLPYEGEQFYDLSSILKKKDDSDDDKESGDNESCKEESCRDCLCQDADDSEPKQDLFINAVAKDLEKIAYELGKVGNHQAAYLVERTIRDIK